MKGFERCCNAKQKDENKSATGRRIDKRDNYTTRLQILDEGDFEGDKDTMVLNVNGQSEKRSWKAARQGRIHKCTKVQYHDRYKINSDNFCSEGSQ